LLDVRLGEATSRGDEVTIVSVFVESMTIIYQNLMQIKEFLEIVRILFFDYSKKWRLNIFWVKY
jgi:hypothetical protein